MTYATLKADITDFLQRDTSSITAAIPVWVRFATAAFNRVLRVADMESRDVTQATGEYTALPGDFLEVIAVRDSDGKRLVYRTRDQFDAIVAAGESPNPAVFTIEDWQLRVWPAPSVSEPQTLAIVYHERIASLVDDDDTNWLLEEEPDLYLYGSLIHARAWLHDEPRLATVKALYDEQLALLKRRKPRVTGIETPPVSDAPRASYHFDITRG